MNVERLEDNQKLFLYHSRAHILLATILNDFLEKSENIKVAPSYSHEHEILVADRNCYLTGWGYGIDGNDENGTYEFSFLTANNPAAIENLQNTFEQLKICFVAGEIFFDDVISIVINKTKDSKWQKKWPGQIKKISVNYTINQGGLS